MRLMAPTLFGVGFLLLGFSLQEIFEIAHIISLESSWHLGHSAQIHSNGLGSSPATRHGAHHLSIGPAGTGTRGSKWPGKGAIGPHARMVATVSSNRPTLARLMRRW